MTSQTTTVHAPGTTAGPESTVRVPRQLQLAAAWTSFMCLYIYVDVLGLYKPGAVAGILEGTVHTFEITQTFFAGALAASAVPIMMILLSTTLAPRANRWTNVIVATLLIPWMAFNLSGGEWLLYYGLGFALELVILLWIVRTSWRWRVTSAVPSLKR